MRLSSRHVAALTDIHELIGRVAPLDEVAMAICRMIQAQTNAAMCAVLRLNDQDDHLRLLTGTHLPPLLQDLLGHLPLNPEAWGCSAAVRRRRAVYDTELIPAADRSRLEPAHGIRACWSYPMEGHEGRILGVLTVFFTTARAPEDLHRNQLALAASLMTLALERHEDRQSLLHAQQRLRSLFHQNPDGVFSLDRDGIVNDVNASVSRIIGFPREDILGQPYTRFVHPVDRPRAERTLSRALGGKGQHIELRARDDRGEERTLDITGIPIVVDGQVIGVHGIAKDVTVDRAREHQLRALERGLDTSINGVIIASALKPDMPVEYVNARFLEMTGYTAEEVMGRNCRFLQGSDTDPASVTLIRERLAKGLEVHVILRNYRKNGRAFWNELSIAPVHDEQGRLTDFVGVQIDISERKAYEARLAYHASHDALTGLPNRSLLEERLDHDLALAMQTKRLLAVLYIDLDDFKPVNDAMGHQVGDRILREVAQRLQELLNPGDTLARLTADEFVILLPNLQREEEALFLTEAVLEQLARPHTLGSHQIYLTASIGIATSAAVIDDPSELIRQADMAMYRAKQRGRNTYEWHTPDITTEVTERLTLRRELEQAIQHKEFFLHFQPILDAGTGRIHGAEALLRWRHPDKGLISPARFIPVAEMTGQIIPISLHVLEEVCRACRRLGEHAAADFRVSVNISPLLFHRPGFLQTLEQILQTAGVPPARLELELTEGVLMERSPQVVDTVNSLREMGFRLAIDDFGTGYSSLSYLKHLPVTVIKIDRSFVRNIGTSREDEAIVQGIITISHQLGFQVVAEGVETAMQEQTLTRLGCDLLQGFRFARPMPLNELRTRLAPPDGSPGGPC
ncbi:MAG: EAL domain-containing protein [Ectothiorhodospiraceae bacterium]|nr:EAL domain-containing protein [Ectothiorhodospiraceae bacterium]